jgi:hypothetical protein
MNRTSKIRKLKREHERRDEKNDATHGYRHDLLSSVRVLLYYLAADFPKTVLI